MANEGLVQDSVLKKFIILLLTVSGWGVVPIYCILGVKISW